MTAERNWYKSSGAPDQLNPLEESKKIRKIIDLNRISRYHRTVYDALFPDAIPHGVFIEQSVAEAQQGALSGKQRNIRRVLMHHFGMSSLRKPRDLPAGMNLQDTLLKHHNIRFLDAPYTLTYALNRWPQFQQLGLIAQTDPRETGYITSRAEHSQEYAYRTTQTLFRLALQSPALFLARVAEDMKRYNDICTAKNILKNHTPFAITPTEKTKELVDKSLHGNRDQDTEEALKVAYEYAKYLIVYAYMHDILTTGWGDIYMKIPSVSYDENAMLQKVSPNPK